jgi:hypothetical protein
MAAREIIVEPHAKGGEMKAKRRRDAVGLDGPYVERRSKRTHPKAAFRQALKPEAATAPTPAPEEGSMLSRMVQRVFRPTSTTVIEPARKAEQ